jgi:hypothetical protein
LSWQCLPGPNGGELPSNPRETRLFYGVEFVA